MLLQIIQAVLAYLATIVTCTSTAQPNIVFIVADDLGWNDIGWHNPHVRTPNLQKLAEEGIRLNNYYVQQVCSPSRSAFMTGYYPYHTGMQHFVLEPMQPTGLPLDVPTLPDMLRKLGYATHMVGKWHLGFCKWEYTPTYRGFDTFYGFYGAVNNYFTHERGAWADEHSSTGLDYRNGSEPVFNQNGVYSAFSFANRAKEIISRHDTKKPLFLYLPFQSVHGPLQVPEKYIKMYENIADVNRRKYFGMVTALDDSVGQVLASLKTKGLMSNTLIAFTTDNGGSVNTAGNNWPLRGSKHNLYEGGTRGVAFVHGPMLKHHNVLYDGLMHAVDWVPTFVEAAGGKLLEKMDGVSQYRNLIENGPSKRTDLVYNADPIDVKAALKMNGFKLILGNPLSPMFLKQGGWFPPPEGDTKQGGDVSAEEEPLLTRPLFGFDVEVRLFNLTADPTEHQEISAKYPKIVDELYHVLMERIKSVATPRYPPEMQRADPIYFKNIWSPGWC